jgi:hypothetical protein
MYLLAMLKKNPKILNVPEKENQNYDLPARSLTFDLDLW